MSEVVLEVSQLTKGYKTQNVLKDVSFSLEAGTATALAGPASNFLLAALALFLYGLLWRDLYAGGAGRFVIRLLQYMAILSISLGLFNLIPIPPLDGSKVLLSFLPDRAYVRLMVLERYGMFLLMALVLILNRAFDVSPVARAAEAVYNVFFRIAVFADSLRG